VKILHPEWNDDMWDAEVALIQKEFPTPVTDPMALPPTLDPNAASTAGSGSSGPVRDQTGKFAQGGGGTVGETGM
jgi:hypothetical protein